MIEVLREGNKMKIECNECGALLRYQVNDVRTECIYLAQRIEDTRKYIICPHNVKEKLYWRHIDK